MKKSMKRWIDKYLEAMGVMLESCEWFPNVRQMNQTICSATLPDDIGLAIKSNGVMALEEERYVSNCGFNG